MEIGHKDFTISASGNKLQQRKIRKFLILIANKNTLINYLFAEAEILFLHCDAVLWDLKSTQVKGQNKVHERMI